MLINDLEKLSRDPKQENLYDLFNKTYVDFPSSKSSQYVVDQDEEMRIDLICYRIYGNVEQVGFLCNYNQIDNPLNIKQGDIINYIEVTEIKLFESEDVTNDEVRKGLLNANKSSRKDSVRQAFIESGYSLPPNFREEPVAPVVVDPTDNTLRISS
jgi:hypothetical protein